MTPLSTFPSPLARLILCGGGGLPGACGRLQMDNDPLSAMMTWSVNSMAIEYVDSAPDDEGVWRERIIGPLERPDRWHLPLDAASPWPERLAKVAVWMVGGRTEFAHVHEDPAGLIVLAWWSGPWRELTRQHWCINGIASAAHVQLPTLPAHLANQPPVVALLLALYDVPEIRARVEAL